MVFEGDLAVKLFAMDVEVRTSADIYPKQDKVTIGRVHSPLSTNDKSLSFIIIQYHAPVIALLLNPSHIPVKEQKQQVCQQSCG